jgi:signal transduction histidine kinase
VERHFRIAVGPRLAFLVAVEMLTAIAMLTLGFVALARVTSSALFLHRFVLLPIQQIGVVLDDATRLGSLDRQRAEDAAIVDRIGEFVNRYRTEIQVANNLGSDAARQIAEMRKAGRLDLIDREARAVAAVEHSVSVLSSRLRDSAPHEDSALPQEEVDRLRSGLRQLAQINLEFVNLAESDIAHTAHNARVILSTVGIAGVLLAGILGLHVWRAIAPRIASLVRKVRRFHEFGVHERAPDEGRDEIAVLANALDAGFAAIANRDRERERFLAVAAHELKTPMVSILGFAQTALAHPDQRERALEIIRRHTTRLGRLVEDLLWAASVRSGQLPFHPVPLDLADVARRIAVEVEEIVPNHAIAVHGPRSVHLLVDEGLIAHALWSMLTYATALSEVAAPLDLSVEPNHACVVTTLQVHGPPLRSDDLMRMFEPFSAMEYEGRGALRAVFGLFLCREIAQVHGGTLQVIDQPGVGPKLTLELPA